MHATHSAHPRRLSVFVILLGLLTAAGIQAQDQSQDQAQDQAQDPAADMAAVGELVNDFVRVWAEGEISAIAGLMTEDARVHEVGFTASDRAEFERRAAQVQRGLQNVQIVSAPDMTLSGNLAYTTMTVSGHHDSPSGAMQVWFRWSLVMRRVDGEWRVAHYHLSGDPDRPRAF